MGSTRLTITPNFGSAIGVRLSSAVNGAISDVQDSSSGCSRIEVRTALIVALGKAWPSGIDLGDAQMDRLVTGIARSTG